MATVACVISAAGVAGAVSGKKVERIIVRKGKVTRGQIAPGAVTSGSTTDDAVTARTLGEGAVGPRALAANAVTTPALASGSIIPRNLAPQAVTAGALAPGAISASSLGTETIVTTPIVDRDAVPQNVEWTASDTEGSYCAPGERLLGGGFGFTNPGTREAAFLQAQPTITPTVSRYVGRITTNSGGEAVAQISAICLRWEGRRGGCLRKINGIGP